MILNRIFSAIPFVLLNLRAPEAAAGGGTKDESPAWPEKAEEVTGETPELQLASAKSIISRMFDAGKALAGKLKDALANVDRIQGVADTATNDLAEEKKQHGVTKAALKSEQEAHKALKDTHETMEKNFGILENLCGVKGIDAQAALKEANAHKKPAGKSANPLVSEYADLVEKEKSGEVKAGTAHKFYRKNKSKLDEFLNAHS